MLALAVSGLQVHVEGGEGEDDLRLVAVHLRLAALPRLRWTLCSLALDFRERLSICKREKEEKQISLVDGRMGFLDSSSAADPPAYHLFKLSY